MKGKFISVSTDEYGTPEHWLRRICLPRPHAEPACGLSRPAGLYATWNAKRVRLKVCLLTCEHCQNLLRHHEEALRSQGGLFDEQTPG